jgi:hypothetical protein
MVHQYQILYDTLVSKTKDYEPQFLTDIDEKKIPLLDGNGYDIMYQLYDMFMKKNNLPLRKFIVKEEECNDSAYDSITLDFKNMPVQLKALLYSFAETHFNSMSTDQI